MKKKFLVILMAVLMIVGVGCGKKNETALQENIGSTQNTQEETPVSKTEAGGVYPGGEKLESIPMGYFCDEKQQIMCNIQIPDNYIFGALYTPDGITDIVIDGVTGETDLKSALENGLREQPNAISIIHAASSDGTVVELRVIPKAETSLEDVKEYAASYQELGTEQHPAVNYEDPSEYITSDVNLFYTLNESFMLLIRYEGPLADKVGNDQLAQNLYDLIEVIE